MDFFTNLFRPVPGTEFNYYIPMIILIILLIGGSIVFSHIYKKRKKEDFAFKRIFRKTPSHLFWFGILFAFLIAVRYERIPYFSMRIWLYISLILFLYWVYKKVQDYRIEYPKQKEHLEARKEKAEKKEKRYTAKKK